MRYWETDRYYDDELFQETLQNYEQSLTSGSVPYLDADDLADVAEYYFAHNNDAKAKEAIKTALELYPDSTILQTYEVRECLSRNEWNKAELLLDEINDYDENREVMYLRTEILLHKEEYKKASRILKEHFPQDDTEDEQRVYVREVIGLLLDYEGTEVDNMANEWGKRMESMGNRCTEDNMMLADLYSCLGKHRQAIDTLTPILEKDPYNKQAWILMTDVKMRAGMEEEGVEAAKYAMAIDDHDLRAIMSLNWIYAEKYRAMKDKPDTSEATLQKLHDECVKGLEWAKKCGLTDTDTFVLSSAEMLMNVDEPLMSIEYFEYDLKFHPESAETWYWLGVALMDTQNYARAEQCLKKAIEINPDNFTKETYAPLSYCYFMLQEIELCLPLLQKACSETPDIVRIYFSRIFPLATPSDYCFLVRHYYAARI